MTGIEFHEHCMEMLEAIAYLERKRDRYLTNAEYMRKWWLGDAKYLHTADISDRAAKRIKQAYIRQINNYLNTLNHE
jgi:hypothetical protein